MSSVTSYSRRTTDRPTRTQLQHGRLSLSVLTWHQDESVSASSGIKPDFEVKGENCRIALCEISVDDKRQQPATSSSQRRVALFQQHAVFGSPNVSRVPCLGSIVAVGMSCYMCIKWSFLSSSLYVRLESIRMGSPRSLPAGNAAHIFTKPLDPNAVAM